MNEENKKMIQENIFTLWDRDSLLINDLNIISLKVEKTRMNLLSVNGFTKSNLRKREWFSFTIGIEEEPTAFIASWYRNNVDETVFIKDINFLDRRRSENRWISLFLNFPSEVASQNTDNVIDKIQHKWRKLSTIEHFLAVFNVGQGSCNAVCNLEGKPLVYLDFGYGSGIKRKDVSLCNCETPLIVLSHLHKDHWNLIEKDKRFYDNIWVVPIQENTLQSLKVFKKLWDLGHLICTDVEFSMDTHNQEILTAFNCDIKNRDINHSGKGFIYHISSEHACLIPGDAKYEVIPQSKSGDNINALIITHHGGNGYFIPPIASSDHISIWNFGKKNSYGHPNPKSIAEHQRFGWEKHLYTHQGNIAIGSKATLGHRQFNTHECPEGHKIFFENMKSFL